MIKKYVQLVSKTARKKGIRPAAKVAKRGARETGRAAKQGLAAAKERGGAAASRVKEIRSERGMRGLGEEAKSAGGRMAARGKEAATRGHEAAATRLKDAKDLVKKHPVRAAAIGGGTAVAGGGALVARKRSRTSVRYIEDTDPIVNYFKSGGVRNKDTAQRMQKQLTNTKSKTKNVVFRSKKTNKKLGSIDFK